MFALATLVFAACSDDHAISDGNSDVVTDPSGDAWVALNIKTPAAVTRGLNTPNQENAITGEYEIEDVKAIFFDGDQDALTSSTPPEPITRSVACDQRG